MPRRRLRPETRARFDPELGVDMTIDLLIGPTTFEADLPLRSWPWPGSCTVRGCWPATTGTRPWAYWVFDLGEEKPQGEWDAEALRLAELGELRPDELAALHERANEAKTRIGTPSELLSDGKSLDRRRVGLYERVEEALGR
jgi:hypothetical protein